jgi:hypothetical protein
MGLQIGLSSLRIDQQLTTKGEAVHGLSPLREADSILISDEDPPSAGDLSNR